MKKFIILGAAVATFAMSSCKKESTGSVAAPESFNAVSTKAADYVESALPRKTLSGNISTNISLVNDTVYVLNGIVAVDNATITIEAGTVIIGQVDGGGKPGTLVVARHGQINAQGTESQPIIFTSFNLLDGNSFTTAAPGDFGGVILLGQAPVNVANKTIEGLDAIEPFDNRYGGNVPTHSSGTFSFVRIEFGGYLLAAGNEINGLTCGGVGSGTVLNHIEVAYGKDDSFEFFGGTVNASYLVSLAPDDDHFDFDNGYNGTINYAIAFNDIYATHSASGANSDSNGIEADNNAPAEDGTFALTPKTHPIINNMTIIGAPVNNRWAAPGYLYAVRIRRGAEIEINKSIFMGYLQAANFDATTSGFYPATTKLKSNIFQGITAAVSGVTLVGADANQTNVFAGTATTTTNFFPKITQPFLNNTKANVNPIPVSTSPATAGGWGAFNNTSRPLWKNASWVKYYF
ncbi:hypothetical protein [Pedobacter psychroterrae]|uniref:hypothetical protein n=1 Tax=Pedobacter psychroterrae TaxID=2530453 RepID=UPI00197E84F8|nr:hypothetical protein [Pedobacter psychroterrae]